MSLPRLQEYLLQINILQISNYPLALYGKRFVPKMKPRMSTKVGNIIGGPKKLLRNKNNKKWDGKIQKQSPPTLFLNK